MRPIASSQSYLRFPLSRVLGTEANVRTLRVLSGSEGPLPVVDVAARAGLSLPGARKALDRLAETGLVVPVGSGRRQQYALRRADPLVRRLRQLFTAEAERYRVLLDRIRHVIVELEPPPRSAWLESSGDAPGAPLQIGLLHHARWLDESLRSLRTRLLPVEREFDLPIELNGYSAAELSDIRSQATTLLFGIPIEEEVPHIGSPAIRSHRDLDDRSLTWANALVRMIRQDPTIVTRAKHHVARLLKEDAGTATQDLREWKDLLESYSTSRLLAFLTATTPRAQRLRQSSPFVAVLTAAQRDRLHQLLLTRPE